jgi:hypothetical protein
MHDAIAKNLPTVRAMPRPNPIATPTTEVGTSGTILRPVREEPLPGPEIAPTGQRRPQRATSPPTNRSHDFAGQSALSPFERGSGRIGLRLGA